MIKVLFFAGLRDQLGVDELQLASADNPDVHTLLNNLRARGQIWASALNNKQLLVAVNQSMAPGNRTLQKGDEVAFFPPVTGG